MNRTHSLAARSALFAAAMSLGLSAPAWAGFSDGERAFDAGDYAAAAAEWRPLADNGDARAQTNLGHLYRLGQGVIRDYDEALKWYRFAADQGNTRAQANLGNMYIKGLGVGIDPVAGVALFRQAAEQGFSVAQLHLGDFYRLGEVVIIDPEQAALWYRRAANQGHPEAALRLSRMYLSGAGVDIDQAQAARWLREAATFGLSPAQYELAELYRRGRGVDADLKEAMRWYHAAAVQGHVRAVERLAASPGYNAQDDPNHQLRVAAEVGDAAAQMRLATLLREGDQVPRDATAALEWYRRAAAQGHPRASYNLGMMYYDGDGVETDDIMAAAWFRRAAGLGESDAQYTLGVFLSKGIGGSADPEQAREWLVRAALQGDSRAQFSLGVMNEKGAGGAVDLAAALKWYGASAAQGDMRAHERHAALTVEMAAQPPADPEPADGAIEKALAESAAEALDGLDRAAADEPAVATAEPESEPRAEPEESIETWREAPAEETPMVALETEAPVAEEIDTQEFVESPAGEQEAETMITGTGIAKRAGNLKRGETAGAGAPVIEFSLFGAEPGDESETEEAPPGETVAIQEDVGAAPEPETEPESDTAEASPETSDEDAGMLEQATSLRRAATTEPTAPDSGFNQFEDPEESVEEESPPDPVIDENAAAEADSAPELATDDANAASTVAGRKGVGTSIFTAEYDLFGFITGGREPNDD